MIASPQNEKLKLVRKLRERKHREREGLFATEGEDLVEAGLAAGAEPRFLLTAAGSGLGGEEVEPELLAAVSVARLRHPGDRGLAAALGASAPGAPCVYLHGVADPGNVGTIVRTAHALLDGPVALGPGCADPFSPKAVRASMGSIFARPPRAGRAGGDAGAAGGPGRPRRRRAGGAGGRRDALPRRRARGAAGRGARRVRGRGDDPAARRRRRVAQRRRRGGDRLRSGYRRPPCRRRSPMLERIEEIRGEAAAAIGAADSSAELEELRVRYLGRKAELTTILRGIAELPPEERGKVGGAANKARKELEALLEASAERLDASELDARLVADRVDVTLPGAPPRPVGHAHLIARTTRLIEDIMVGLGYRVSRGRRSSTTTTTSPPSTTRPGTRRGCSRTPSTCSRTPTCCCAPTPRRCRCARWRRSRRRSSSSSPARSTGATPTPPTARCSTRWRAWRSPRGSPSPTSRARCWRSAGRSSATSARCGCGPTSSPSPSPASRSTSPASSAAAAARCPTGERCNLCKGQGWIEILGAGMVDPNVLGFVEEHGYDPERVQGFAFGLGVERVAMLRHGVPDLRRFFDNDVRMLEQFG